MVDSKIVSREVVVVAADKREYILYRDELVYAGGVDLDDGLAQLRHSTFGIRVRGLSNGSCAKFGNLRPRSALYSKLHFRCRLFVWSLCAYNVNSYRLPADPLHAC